MATAAKGKSGKAAPARRSKMNRVAPTPANIDLATIGGRMILKRLALGWTQAQVADEIIFVPQSGERKGEEVTLTRSAYAMWESGGVPQPSISMIIGAAKALRTSPAYLAFGIEEGSVEAIAFDPRLKKFVKTEPWILPQEWLRDNFALKQSEVRVVVISDELEAGFVPGDAVIIKAEDTPTTAGGEFLYVYKGEICVGHVSRVRSDLRVSAAGKNAEILSASKVQIIGRVVSKIEGRRPNH